VSALRDSAVEIHIETSVADEADRHSDSLSQAANEGRENGDSSEGSKWSHHCLQFGRSSKLNNMANSWLDDIENSTDFFEKVTVSDI
jgi:hypothetical protein